ncbi:MAG: formate--tetrahydrofolate ligase [Culicoidibacterales bacterium]
MRMVQKMKTDLQIAQANEMADIREIAQQIGLGESDLELYGKYKAKISQHVMESVQTQPDGKLVLVTAINPTPAGEGKSTVTIGLAQALQQLNQKAIVALREPSLGPVMGMKGGAAGGGHAQVVPMEDLNLHFTGDMHAITTANNMISAFIDNHIFQGNELGIDRVVWRRCVDLNDRSLREIEINKSRLTQDHQRQDGFDITVASEIMAVLCLAENLDDLRTRIGKIVVAYTATNQPITVQALAIEGAVTLILRDALLPNLVQTLEKTPAIVHGGPFANIAHGCNSVQATKLALKLGDYAITEAGFGADLGAEKFMDIKCRMANLKPDATVIVATIRALKMHGGVDKANLTAENVSALEHGLVNLEKHIENMQQFGVPFVVAINKFVTDTDAEVAALQNWAEANNYPIALCEVWEHGGKGGIALAEKVMEICETQVSNYAPLYDLELSIADKIRTIATKIYGAANVEFTPEAQAQMADFTASGWDHLPICMAKTQYSFSDNPQLLGRPTDFTLTIRELRASVGAGFIVALTGAVLTMPGLPKKPAMLQMDVAADGKAVGLF